MKHLKIHGLTLCLLGLLCTDVCAQMTPAWTRQLSPARWHELSRKVVLASTQKETPFMDLSRRLNVVAQVKTTDQNWLRHTVFYSKLFSRQEKDILLCYTYPRATLGKLAYLYDKHAAFYTQLSHGQEAGHINQSAFLKHQQILHELTGTLQQYYLEQHPFAFVSEIFSKEEIQHLAQTNQPTAYVLTSKELKEFSNLPILQGQQSWVQRKIQTTTWETEMLLSKNTSSMTPAEFEHYYIAQRRLSYFKLLDGVLQKSNKRRLSAVLRYRTTLTTQGEKLTDAQRGGKLLFEQGENSPAFQEFTQIYGPYATAEALQAPYEIALQYGVHAPELLGKQEGQRLRQLSPLACLKELLPKIADLQNQLNYLHRQVPADNSFYITYYGLHTQLTIYKILAARAQVMINFSK